MMRSSCKHILPALSLSPKTVCLLCSITVMRHYRPLHWASSAERPLRAAGNMATDPDMLTFRVSTSRSKALYYCTESTTEVTGQWVTSHCETRHATVNHHFSFHSFAFLEEKQLWGKCKSGLTDWRCEGLNKAPRPKILSCRDTRGKALSVPLKFYNVLAEQVKGNLPVLMFTVMFWACIVWIHWVGTLFKLSFKSVGHYKWCTLENIQKTKGCFSVTVGVM